MRLNPPNFPSISAFIIIISRTTKLPPDSETNKKKWTEKKKKKKLNGWNENIHIKYKSYFYVLKLYSSWISLWLCKRIFPDNFFSIYFYLYYVFHFYYYFSILWSSRTADRTSQDTETHFAGYTLLPALHFFQTIIIILISSTSAIVFGFVSSENNYNEMKSGKVIECWRIIEEMNIRINTLLWVED